MLLKLGEIDQKLMGNLSIFVFVAKGIVAVQSVCHVIGIEKCEFRGICEALATEHLDIRPRDEENGGASEWCGRHGVDGLATTIYSRMGGKEGCQMFGNTDWSAVKVSRSD